MNQPIRTIVGKSEKRIDAVTRDASNIDRRGFPISYWPDSGRPPTISIRQGTVFWGAGSGCRGGF
jgi:hypothetical protein